MVWAFVASTGEKTPLVFFEDEVKINQHVYLKWLKKQLVIEQNRIKEKTGKREEINLKTGKPV